jgi:hypothetical protein
MDIARETLNHTSEMYLNRVGPVSLEAVAALALVVLIALGALVMSRGRRKRRGPGRPPKTA